MGKITDKGYQSNYSGDAIDELLAQIGINKETIKTIQGDSSTEGSVDDGKIDTLSEITYFLKDMPTNKTLSSEIEEINKKIDSSILYDEIDEVDDLSIDL